MKRRYQDMVSLQFGDDRIYLVRGEHEVPGRGNVAGICCLRLMASPTPAAGGIVIPAIVMVSLRGTPNDSALPLNVPLRPTASSTGFTHAGGAGSSTAATGVSTAFWKPPEPRAAKWPVAKTSVNKSTEKVFMTPLFKPFLRIRWTRTAQATALPFGLAGRGFRSHCATACSAHSPRLQSTKRDRRIGPINATIPSHHKVLPGHS
jgi:hypothetical protein